MKQHTCPECGSIAGKDGNKFFPFCSERCKLIDLGRWASEKYKIPVKEDEENLKEIKTEES
jgi:endogenous inhibitor of DNA gyrase (YacG/DUF329 family)